MLELIPKKLPQELQDIAEQNIGRGIETTFVLDDIEFRVDVNGKAMKATARGFAENEKVYIKVNNTFTAEQINGHETFHVDAGRYPGETVRIWKNISKIVPKGVIQSVFEQYQKRYSDIYESARLSELAQEELLADIAGEMNPLSNIPEVREAVGRFYDAIYGKGAGEEFRSGIDSSRYSVNKKEAAGEPAAFSLGREADAADEIMGYFEGENGARSAGEEMSFEAMMVEAARSQKEPSQAEADAAASGIMAEMEGEGKQFNNNNGGDIINESEPQVLFEYIKKSDLKLVETKPNSAYFWSGQVDGKSVEGLAATISQSKKGNTLEMIVENKGLEMPIWDLADLKTIKAWQELSKEYAMRASGEIRVIIGSRLRPGNIWETIELPALKKNPKVTKIIVIDPKTRQEKIIFER